MTLAVSELGSTKAKGLTSGFDSFFEAEAPSLFRRLCLITGDRYEAEDVTQEAFVRVLERWDRVSGMDDPTGYLYRTAFNLHRKRLRRAALALRRIAWSAPPSDAFAAADDRHLVNTALAGITPRQRAALVLTELMGYGSEAAAGVLGVRPGTVRALATQGRAAMKQVLGKIDE